MKFIKLEVLTKPQKEEVEKGEEEIQDELLSRLLNKDEDSDESNYQWKQEYFEVEYLKDVMVGFYGTEKPTESVIRLIGGSIQVKINIEDLRLILEEL